VDSPIKDIFPMIEVALEYPFFLSRTIYAMKVLREISPCSQAYSLRYPKRNIHGQDGSKQTENGEAHHQRGRHDADQIGFSKNTTMAIQGDQQKD
jgi:hypothetical protein